MSGAEVRGAILAKDCKIRVNYVQETIWYTYAGGTLVDVDIRYTFSSETTISEGVGCGGGNKPPGDGSGSPGGPGSGSGKPNIGSGGPGVIVINTDPNDPNNRCIEEWGWV